MGLKKKKKKKKSVALLLTDEVEFISTAELTRNVLWLNIIIFELYNKEK